MSERERAVTVIVPVYNEAGAVAETLRAVQAAFAGRELELIAVDDASTDGSGAILASLPGVKVLTHAVNMGYGRSLKDGIRAASNEKLGIIDADGSYPVGELPALFDELDGRDMVIGRRRRIPYVNLAWVKRAGRLGMNLLASLVARSYIRDLNTGLRVFRRSRALPWLDAFSERFSFSTGLTMAGYGQGWKVSVRMVDYYPRVGESKVKLVKDSLRTVRIIFRIGWACRPVWTAACGAALAAALPAALLLAKGAF